MMLVLALLCLVASTDAAVSCRTPGGISPCSTGLSCPGMDAYASCIATDSGLICCRNEEIIPPSTCEDKVGPSGYSDCPSRRQYCDNPVYYDLMTHECPKTCNRCNGGGGSTCVDKVGPTGVSDCGARAYLCTNPVYHELMEQQCPKTCGFCV